MSRGNVLITAPVHSYLIQTLTEKGFEVRYEPAITYEQCCQEIVDCVGLIITTRIRVDQNMIDQAKQLQWMGRLGSGMELIDVEYARSKGIQCESSPEGNRETVGEQAVGMLLMLMHNLLKSSLELREGIWERDGNRGYEIGGRTIGIIGYGNTGDAFARKLRGFDVRILAYDKYKSNFSNDYVTQASMEQIFAEADIVSTHLPLTAETKHLVNRKFFEQFQHPPIYINTARGKLVDTASLIEAVDAGLVRGVCLDVLENEKLNSYSEQERKWFQYLVHHPKVILTPHIAGYSHEASIRMPKVVLQKLGIL
jgi:D-3-phosphoglycerate dehydrogenase